MANDEYDVSLVLLGSIIAVLTQVMVSSCLKVVGSFPIP